MIKSLYLFLCYTTTNKNITCTFPKYSNHNLKWKDLCGNQNARHRNASACTLCSFHYVRRGGRWGEEDLGFFISVLESFESLKEPPQACQRYWHFFFSESFFAFDIFPRSSTYCLANFTVVGFCISARRFLPVFMSCLSIPDSNLVKWGIVLSIVFSLLVCRSH